MAHGFLEVIELMSRDQLAQTIHATKCLAIRYDCWAFFLTLKGDSS